MCWLVPWRTSECFRSMDASLWLRDYAGANCLASRHITCTAVPDSLRRRGTLNVVLGERPQFAWVAQEDIKSRIRPKAFQTC